jgi:hypothetical protein
LFIMCQLHSLCRNRGKIFGIALAIDGHWSAGLEQKAKVLCFIPVFFS